MAAISGGQASAATLTGFAGYVNTDWSNVDIDAASNNLNTWNIGAGVAGPLSVPNLNFQVDFDFRTDWATHYGNNGLAFDGNVFWAGDVGRFGLRGAYDTTRHIGSLASFSAFGEMYFGAITGMAKAGYVNASGNGIIGGARGGSFGGALSGYVMPDLAITGSGNYSDLVGGRGFSLAGRGDLSNTELEIIAEYLFMEEYGLSVYGGYAYDDIRFFDNNPGGLKTHSNVYLLGLRWYTGGGSLMDHHRNGTLHPWLNSSGFSLAPFAFGGSDAGAGD
jgi:hypothetical protein